MIFAAVAAIVVVALGVISANGAFDLDIWIRKNPLVAPIAVEGVHDGTITLANGRTFWPAGVRRGERVSAEDYDRALRTIP